MTDKISGTPILVSGGRIRKSPYYDATIRYSCQLFTVYNHMYLPLIYEDSVADYWHLVRDVSIWDVACERQVEITGEDAFPFVQRLTPLNLTKVSVGQCKYTAITDEESGIISDLVLLRLGENHFWLSIADKDMLLWARGVALDSGFEVEIREPDVARLAVQGPKAAAMVADFFGERVNEFRYFWFRETELQSIPLVLARSGWSKQGGFELYLRDADFADELWERVMKAGKPYDIAPGAPSGFERIEGALLNYGTDMTMENNPLEMGLGKFVDLEQEAEFIGKEALRRIEAEGVNQTLVGIEIYSDELSSSKDRWPIRRMVKPRPRSCHYPLSLQGPRRRFSHCASEQPTIPRVSSSRYARLRAYRESTSRLTGAKRLVAEIIEEAGLLPRPKKHALAEADFVGEAREKG